MSGSGRNRACDFRIGSDPGFKIKHVYNSASKNKISALVTHKTPFIKIHCKIIFQKNRSKKKNWFCWRSWKCHNKQWKWNQTLPQDSTGSSLHWSQTLGSARQQWKAPPGNSNQGNESCETKWNSCRSCYRRFCKACFGLKGMFNIHKQVAWKTENNCLEEPLVCKTTHANSQVDSWQVKRGVETISKIHSFIRETNTNRKKLKNNQDKVNKETHRIEIQSKLYLHLPRVPNIIKMLHLPSKKSNQPNLFITFWKCWKTAVENQMNRGVKTNKHWSWLSKFSDEESMLMYTKEWIKFNWRMFLWLKKCLR